MDSSTLKHYAGKKQQEVVSLQRLRAHSLLKTWRKKNAKKLHTLDAVKAIRGLRDGAYR